MHQLVYVIGSNPEERVYNALHWTTEPDPESVCTSGS